MKTLKRRKQEIDMIDDEYHGQPWAIVLIVAFVVAGGFTAGVMFFVWLLVQIFGK